MLKCKFCSFKCASHTMMIDHLKRSHQSRIETNEKSFSSDESFPFSADPIDLSSMSNDSSSAVNTESCSGGGGDFGGGGASGDY
jgi:uncharacterized membrane protein YgcG